MAKLKEQPYLPIDMRDLMRWASYSFPVREWPCAPKPYVLGGFVGPHNLRYLHGMPVTETTPPLSDRQAIYALYGAFGTCALFVQSVFLKRKVPTSHNQLNPIRTNVLIKLTYLVGFSGMLQFKGMREAVLHADWKLAGNALWNSKLSTRFPRLTRQLAVGMNTGTTEISGTKGLLYEELTYTKEQVFI